MNIKKNKKNGKFLGFGLGLGLSALMVAGVFGGGNSTEAKATSGGVHVSVYAGDIATDAEFVFSDLDDEDLEQRVSKFNSLSYEQQKSLLTEFLTYTIKDIESSAGDVYNELLDMYKRFLGLVEEAKSVEDIAKIVKDDGGILAFEVFDYVASLEEMKIARESFASKSFEDQKSLLTSYIKGNLQNIGNYGYSEYTDVFNQYSREAGSISSSEEMMNFMENNDLFLDMLYYEEYLKENEKLKNRFLSMDFGKQKSLLQGFLTSLAQDGKDFGMDDFLTYSTRQLEKVNLANSTDDLVKLIDEDYTLLESVFYADENDNFSKDMLYAE